MRQTCLIGYLILSVTSLAGTGVSLQIVQGRPIVDGIYVNGHGPCRFLVDTGAQSNHSDVQVARRFGLLAMFRVHLDTIAGTELAPGMAQARVRLGETEVQSTEVLFTKLNAVRELSDDIQGVLGQAFLAQFDYLLDMRGRRMVFGAPEPAGIKAAFDMQTKRPGCGYFRTTLQEAG